MYNAINHTQFFLFTSFATLTESNFKSILPIIMTISYYLKMYTMPVPEILLPPGEGALAPEADPAPGSCITFTPSAAPGVSIILQLIPIAIFGVLSSVAVVIRVAADVSQLVEEVLQRAEHDRRPVHVGGGPV